MPIFRFEEVHPSNYFCSDGKLFGFDAATKVNTRPVWEPVPEKAKIN
jgi:hypothetical protein